jgi:hypothetical protein
MPGKLILVKPGRLAKFIAKPAPGDAFALPSGASAPDDGRRPAPLLQGQPRRHLRAAGAGGTARLEGSRPPGRLQGLQVQGRRHHGGSLQVVLIRTRIVKGLCRGGAIKLDPPATGDVGVLLTVGSTPMTYLAVFGGEEIRNTADELKAQGRAGASRLRLRGDRSNGVQFPPNGVGSGICGNVTDGHGDQELRLQRDRGRRGQLTRPRDRVPGHGRPAATQGRRVHGART